MGAWEREESKDHCLPRFHPWHGITWLDVLSYMLYIHFYMCRNVYWMPWPYISAFFWYCTLWFCLELFVSFPFHPRIAGMAPWCVWRCFFWLRFRERCRRFRPFQGCCISAVCYKWCLGHWPPLLHIIPPTKAPRRTVAETLATSLAPELPGDLPAELLDEELPLATEGRRCVFFFFGERYPGRWMNWMNSFNLPLGWRGPNKLDVRSMLNSSRFARLAKKISEEDEILRWTTMTWWLEQGTVNPLMTHQEFHEVRLAIVGVC